MIERVNEPTPRGGAYSIATYLAGDPMHEVSKADATFVLISEYTWDGRWLGETCGTFTPEPPQPTKPHQAGVAARLKALGIKHDDSPDSTLTFLGPKGVAARSLTAAARDTFGYNPDEPRDDHGRWTGGGGSSGGSSESDKAAAAQADQSARFAELKTKWADLDRELLPYAGNPEDPAAKALIDQQLAVNKEMHALNCDQGNAAGIGMPGGPRDVVVVGAGPAGLQASIYGGAEGLDTLMVDQNTQPGGQIGLTSRTENVLGFPAGVTGAELATTGLEQAQRLGAETKLGVGVTNMTYNPETGLKTLSLSDGTTVDARSVIIAGGVQFNQLNFPGSDSHGVIYGDSTAIKAVGGPAVFVGGGNSAGQAAVDVAGNGQDVTLLVRGPEGSLNASMSSYLTDQLESSPNVEIRYNSEIASGTADANGQLQSVTLKDGTSVPANEVGVFIGSSPKTGWAGDVATGDHGAILTGRGGAGALETNIPGVYAAGDVRDGSMHRVVAAAGEGGTALSSAWQYVNSVFGGKGAKTAALVSAARKSYPGDDYLMKLKALDEKVPFTGFDPTASLAHHGGRM